MLLTRVIYYTYQNFILFYLLSVIVIIVIINALVFHVTYSLQNYMPIPCIVIRFHVDRKLYLILILRSYCFLGLRSCLDLLRTKPCSSSVFVPDKKAVDQHVNKQETKLNYKY